ncbi:MAG TPA: DUF2786 domain-containing protein [Euzebyales bacterium]
MGRNNKKRRAAKKRQRARRAGGRGRRRATQQPDVRSLLLVAVEAWEHAPDAHDEAVDLLLELAAGGVAVAGTVAHGIEQALDRLWRDGWTPTDVAHVTARRLTGAHRDIVSHAVVADGRERATSGTPPHERWQIQLDTLADGLLDTQTRSPVDDVRLLVPVLALLLRLPAIPAVMPAPDASATVDQAAATRMDQRMLARVRGLLAKAESTPFDEEAEALTAKAQELITRHAIADALLHAEDEMGEPSIRRVPVDNPYPDAKAALLSAIAEANRCEAVHSPDMGWVTLCGFDGDLDAVELLGASLLAQATGAMATQGSRRDRHGRSITRSFRRAFLYGFASRIGERLRHAAEQQVHDEADQDRLLPVLAARDTRVADAVAAAFPELDRRPLSLSNPSGWVAGHVAADLADLSGHRQRVDDHAS